MLHQFSRTELLLGSEALARLSRAHVAVFGIGGVGGHAVEALARSGVGALTLVDHDRVSITNVNRQAVATLSAIGRPKVDVMAERIADINPACEVACHQCFYLPETAARFDLSSYDYVVDAVDTVTAKLQLMAACSAAHTPIISSMGAANKLDPCAFAVADIEQTSIDPLARIIRKECRKRGIGPVKVVYSTEPAIPIPADAMARAVAEEQAAQDDDGTRPSRHGVPGSVSFVPSVAGLIIAGEVVRDLIGIVR